MMQIGADSNGKVWLAGDLVPSEWNGMALTVHDLTDEQEAAYTTLPSERGGAMFDGKTFKAIAASPLPAQKTLADQIIADPKELAKLKAALAG